jgi:hypothetical protein
MTFTPTITPTPTPGDSGPPAFDNIPVIILNPVGELCNLSVEPFWVRDNPVSYGIGVTGIGPVQGSVKVHTISGSDISFSFDLMPPAAVEYSPYGLWRSKHQGSKQLSGVTPTTNINLEILVTDNVGKTAKATGSFTGCVGN